MSQFARWHARAIVTVTAVAAVGALTLAGAPTSSAATSSRVLSMSFDDITFAGNATRFINGADFALAITAVSAYGGTVSPSAGRLGSTDKALRLPRFDATSGGQRVVVRVIDRKAADNLDPRARPFTFGADFVRDAASEREGSFDNGDNLIQRGLFGNQSQYKIQLDHGLARCRIKGTLGVVDVTSPVQIDAGRWYRARCSRTASTVRLAVTRWSPSGAAVTTTTTRPGATGRLTPSTRAVPLSIGGKLRADGTIVSASDQFNGRIDNALLRIR